MADIKAVKKRPVSGLLGSIQDKLNTLPLKRKFTVAFGGLILLMVASLVFTLTQISDIGGEAEHVIEHRQKSAILFQRLSGDINLATTHLNAYLLTGDQDFEDKFLEIDIQMLSRIAEIETLLSHDEDDILKKSMEKLNQHITSFREYVSTLVRLHKNNSINFPGIELATETLNPPALAYVGLVNELLEEEIEGSASKQKQVYKLLSDMRYSWAQMMNGMRLYFNQGSDRDMANFTNYAELNRTLHMRLQELDVDIGFDGVESLGEIRDEYMAGVPEIISYRKSDEWRRDVFIMKSELTHRVVGDMRSLINELVSEQVDASQKSGRALTGKLQDVILVTLLIIVVGVILGAVFSVKLTQGILFPITNLMQAARQVAEGDLNVEVYVSAKDEIGQLSKSFNLMLDELRNAEVQQQEYMDELQTLNAELEERVRKRTEELEKTETRTRAVLDNMGEGIIVVKENGYIESVNPAAEKIFGFGKISGEDIHSSILIDSDELKAESNSGTENPGDDAFAVSDDKQPKELVGKRADGTVFPMEMVVTQMYFGEDRMRACIVRDISSRKETENRLQDAQYQLLDAAHKSGMAEMATGVLHNIGNILNSVNVSVEEVARVARTSKVVGLEKANTMVKDHMSDLGDFFTNDSKGKKLPDYFIKVGGIVRGEMATVLEETTTLREKVTMMKDVISTQQAYAHTGFFNEEFQIEPLIQDALKVQEASVRKWGVNVTTDIQAVPDIVGQKSKLLQVITNLIKNAKEAMLENDIHNKPKEMGVTVGLYKDKSVFVCVKDNGCGIDQDNLDKIFNHGFTTKEAGHGFGLHASANAMTEMGGSLTAQSEGENLGATFTVSIPVTDTVVAVEELPEADVKLATN